jgi:uncharacterized membrane protein YeaQ/YmgE (transglycosylase-associated protein family)
MSPLLASSLIGLSSGPWLYWIVIGLIAGWATGRLMRGAGYGIIFDIILGMVGAVIGGFIMGLLGFSGSGGFFYTLTVAIIGAIILVSTTRVLTGRRI